MLAHRDLGQRHFFLQSAKAVQAVKGALLGKNTGEQTLSEAKRAEPLILTAHVLKLRAVTQIRARSLSVPATCGVGGFNTNAQMSGGWGWQKRLPDNRKSYFQMLTTLSSASFNLGSTQRSDGTR